MKPLSDGLTHIVIGLGEVGGSLKRVLEEMFEVDGIDANSEPTGKKYDYVHICFPYSSNFTRIAKLYIKRYLKPGGVVLVHSTVRYGTTRRLGPNAVHSPIRGVHPNIAAGIKTFTKYFGGKEAMRAALPFADLKIPTKVIDLPEATEALKLWDTTYYGWNIIFQKEMWDFCLKNDIPFDFVYTEANKSYNEGYKKLGKEHVIRPVLAHMTGPIGGHCVVPNAKLLGGDIAKVILSKNKTYERGS